MCKVIQAPPREPDAIVRPYSWFDMAVFTACGVFLIMALLVVWPNPVSN